MDEHYQTLGVSKDATPEDIKKAYRKLASLHHPDKGGDTAKFQEIQSAYEVLGDPEKRQQYDNPNPFHNNFQSGNGGVPPGFEDLFRHFGFGDFQAGFNRRPPPRNVTLNLQTFVTLEEAFTGKDLVATIQLPSGRDQIVNVKIPAGVSDNTTLKLRGIGDDSVPGAPRGDVHLSVNVQLSSEFDRNGADLIKTIDICALDAILGTEYVVRTIDKKDLSVTIPAGTQPNTTLAIQGHGMPNMHDPRFKGRLLLKINIIIPSSITAEQKYLITQARKLK